MRCCQPAAAPGSVGSSPRPAVLNQNSLCLGEQEKDDIAASLNMWANYIETHSIHYSATDEGFLLNGKPIVLDEFQKQRVSSLRNLATKVLASD